MNLKFDRQNKRDFDYSPEGDISDTDEADSERLPAANAEKNVPKKHAGVGVSRKKKIDTDMSHLSNL